MEDGIFSPLEWGIGQLQSALLEQRMVRPRAARPHLKIAAQPREEVSWAGPGLDPGPGQECPQVFRTGKLRRAYQ